MSGGAPPPRTTTRGTLVLVLAGLLPGMLVGALLGRSAPQTARVAMFGAQQQARGGCHAKNWLQPLRNRNELPFLLEAEGFTTGAELGVQRGWFSGHLLAHWPSARRFYLVDAWAHQAAYEDVANVPQERQEAILAEARANLARHAARTVWLRNFTTDAARLIKEPLDFVYVDARHDYCGVLEDLAAYWPLLRPGGIMAGHDYMTAPEVRKHTPRQDWSICANGSVIQGAVVGAVGTFFAQLGLQVSICYREPLWNTWVVRKPFEC